MRFKATVDETGRVETICLDDKEMMDHVVGFQVTAQAGEPTRVKLDLVLVDVDLNLADVRQEEIDQ